MLEKVIKDNISSLNNHGYLKDSNGKQSKWKSRKPQDEQLSEFSLSENWFKEVQGTKMPLHLDSTLE